MSDTANDPEVTSDGFNFDGFEQKVIPFRYKGVDYELREASEDAAAKYKNKLYTSTKWSADGQVRTMGNMGDLESFLIAMCLFRKDRIKQKDNTEAEKWVSVPEATVRSWPRRMTKQLFDKINEISELDTDDTEESLEKEIALLQKKLQQLRDKKAGKDPAKNEQGDTEITLEQP